MKKIILIAFLQTMAFWAKADPYADSIRGLEGTISSSFEEQTVQGKLQGCMLLYKNIIFDHAYAKGVPYVVYGSIGVGLNSKNQMLASLKVITNKMQPVSGQLVMKPERPYFAYLKSPSGVNNAKSLLSKTNSDTEGGIFEIFNLDDSFFKILDGIVESFKVSVVFNRHSGGVDVYVPVDLSVIDVKKDGAKLRDPSHILQFVNCMQKLASQAK